MSWEFAHDVVLPAVRANTSLWQLKVSHGAAECGTTATALRELREAEALVEARD